jgi:mono/diheme cytochrome c family protein
MIIASWWWNVKRANKGLQIGSGFATFALMQRIPMPQSRNVQFFKVPSIMEDTMKAFRFIRRSAVFLGAGLLLISAGCSTPPGEAEEGQRWYSMHNCYACHGRQGSDGKAPEIYPLDMSYRHFKGIVRDAGSPIMPKYSEEKIPDGDVADIYAWLTRK